MNATLAALNALPDGAAIILPVPTLRALLSGNDEGMLTVKDVARLTHRGAGAVRKWLRAGLLRATLVGRKYLIKREDFDAFLSEQPTRASQAPPRSELSAEELSLGAGAWRGARSGAQGGAK